MKTYKMKFLLFGMLFLAPTILSAQTENTDKKNSIDTANEEVFVVVEQNPEFPGGEEARMKFVRENIKYPKIAAEKGIQGNVFVGFIVEKDGSITNIKIVRGKDPSLDEEALRVTKLMPKWKPAMQRGKPVRCILTMPITFKLD